MTVIVMAAVFAVKVGDSYHWWGPAADKAARALLSSQAQSGCTRKIVFSTGWLSCMWLWDEEDKRVVYKDWDINETW